MLITIFKLENMDKMRKWNTRLEKIWLIISILATIAALIFSIQDQFQGDLVYYLLAVFSWGIYFVRRGLSRRLNKLN